MKADKGQPGTAALEQWLRAVCDETDESELRLAADSAAAADLHEARELVAELRDVLQPEPLPEALVTAIHTRICRQSGQRYRVVRFIAPLAVAAAATLAMAVTTRYSSAPQERPTESASLALSAEDAADIVAANVLLSWEGQFQASVNEIATEVGGLQEAAERISQAGGNLPWSAEDDWDAVKTEGQSRAGFDSRA